MRHAEALKHLPQFERPDLRVLLRVIDGAPAALKLDAHGDWIIRRLRQPQLYHSGVWSVNDRKRWRSGVLRR